MRNDGREAIEMAELPSQCRQVPRTERLVETPIPLDIQGRTWLVHSHHATEPLEYASPTRSGARTPDVRHTVLVRTASTMVLEPGPHAPMTWRS